MKYNIHNQVEDFFAEQDRLNQLDRGEKNLDIAVQNYKQDKQYKQYKKNKKINYANKQFSLNDQAPPVVGSLRESNVFAACPQGKDLPGSCRTIKLDLFNNSKDLLAKPYQYNLKINLYMYEPCEANQFDPRNAIRYSCSLNDQSVKSIMAELSKFGLQAHPHYKAIKKQREKLNAYRSDYGIEHLAINKMYQPTKRGLKAEFSQFMSAMLIRSKNNHMVQLYIGDQIFTYELQSDTVTPAMKQSNIIATVTVRAEDQLIKKQKDDPSTYLL
jgi:hypothetical protein